MRPIVLTLCLTVVSACSGSDAAPPPAPLFGGFTPQGVAAAVFAPAICDVAYVGTVSISAVAVVFTDHDRACEVMKATQLCGTRASSTEVIGFAIQGVLGSGGVGPASAGTYAFMQNPPTGPFRAATGDAARVDATCHAVSADAPDVTGGSITLSTIEANRVAGSVDFRFEGDQQFQQPFDVAVCTTTIDLCAKLQPCWDYVCAPTTI